MQFLAIMFLTSIAFAMALQYRIELIFRHRNQAIAILHELSGGERARVVFTMFRYYDKYKISHQLLALNKWKFDDFFQGFSDKLLRIKLKYK